MRRHLLTIAVILTVAPGCDNVTWGGQELTIVPPPASPDPATTEGAETAVPAAVNVDHPVLLAGIREDRRASLTLVGEVDGDALRPFPDTTFRSDIERLEALTGPGAEWTLFSEGVRVGRLVVDTATTADAFCGSRTTVSGVVELVPPAADAVRLLALPSADAADHPYGDYEELAHVYDQRVASLAIVQRAIPQYGAEWPPLGVLDARKHIQVFALRGQGGPFVAATFMHEDRLEVVPPGRGAYAMFVMGQQDGDEYRDAYVWYRAVDTDGKGAPRYFDHLDWDGDGDEEILLDVFGSNRRWFASLAQSNGSWVRSFQDACGSGSSTGS